jgi:predicted XRE-type DNA-binding protein
MDVEPSNDPNSVVDSSGNVFADLGLPHSDMDMLKYRIAAAISDTVKKRDLTQVEAARILRIDQAKISAILRGRLTGFSVERLVGYLVMLGRDIDIHISQRYKNKPGRIKVAA